MTEERASLRLDLRAQALLALAQFRRQGIAKIVSGKDLADVDLVTGAEWRALHPADCFVKGRGLDQPEAGDEIAGQGKRPLARRGLAATGIFDARTARGRMQALACLDHAGFRHL